MSTLAEGAGTNPNPNPNPSQALGVSTSAEGGGTDFTHLFDLVLICNLASLLPLFALRFLDEAEPPPEAGEGSGAMPSALPSANEAASGPEAAAGLGPVANLLTL